MEDNWVTTQQHDRNLRVRLGNERGRGGKRGKKRERMKVKEGRRKVVFDKKKN